jgi:DNA-binding MurR/RpiR family transcriptional regulator
VTTASILAIISAFASFLLELAKAYSTAQAKQAGENVVKNADLQKTVDQLQTAQQIDARVSGMSDTAIADELHNKFQRD